MNVKFEVNEDYISQYVFSKTQNKTTLTDTHLSFFHLNVLPACALEAKDKSNKAGNLRSRWDRLE